MILDGLLLTLTILILCVQFVGGGVLNLGPIVVTMRTLYTPMLVLTALVSARVLVRHRLEFGWQPPPEPRRLWRPACVSAVTALILLGPQFYALIARTVEGRFVRPPILWRSSAPGADLAAIVRAQPQPPACPDGNRGVAFPPTRSVR